jgi:serine/threonine protein kinase
MHTPWVVYTRYTVKADMWSAGCCLYEVCALTPAFTAKSIEHLMVKIRGGAVPVDRLPEQYVVRCCVAPCGAMSMI